MHTQCPACLTIFRIGAVQLAEGRGQVRCGECRRAFAALDTLSDVLPDAHQPSLRLYAAPSKPVELLQVTRSAPAAQEALFAPLANANAIANVQDEAPPRIESGYGDLTEVFDADPATGEPFHGIAATPAFDENGWPIAASIGREASLGHVRVTAFATPDAGAVAPASPALTSARTQGSQRPLDRIAAPRAHPAAIEPAAPAFARHASPRAHAGSGWGWWLASASLVVILAGQVAWAGRTQLMDVPALRPWLLQACEAIRCPLPVAAVRDSITLAARDVRPHPSVGGALIIGATLVNEADFSQAFPVVEITLADVNEQRVGMRRFRPDEYVSDRRTLQRGIPPSGTALFNVEVEDPGKRAVAFEFKFL